MSYCCTEVPLMFSLLWCTNISETRNQIIFSKLHICTNPLHYTKLSHVVVTHNNGNNKKQIAALRSALHFSIKINHVIWGYGLTQFKMWLLNWISRCKTAEGATQLRLKNWFYKQISFNVRMEPQIPNCTGSLTWVHEGSVYHFNFHPNSSDAGWQLILGLSLQLRPNGRRYSQQNREDFFGFNDFQLPHHSTCFFSLELFFLNMSRCEWKQNMPWNN